MTITSRCTHKIAVINRTEIDIFHAFETELERGGISSQRVREKDLDSDVLIDARVLFIEIDVLDRETLSSLLHQIPELAGLLSIYRSEVRKYQVLKDTATARSERVALVGAFFLGSEADKEGRKLCREAGIPFLGTGEVSHGSSILSALYTEPLLRLFSQG